jgi:membrane peptidoglycan carboxypeptidase
VHVPPRTILKVIGPDGHTVWQASKPSGTQAVSPQAAFLTSDILAGNTDPNQNPIWAAKLELRNGPRGAHRAAAVKTGTSNEATDLSTYGFLAAPASPDQPALAVGVWMGNSDHSNPTSATPATSLTAAAPLWHAFVRDYTSRWPVARFVPPQGVVRATIDAWSGGAPGPWTRQTAEAWFIAGTQPGAGRQIDPNGLLYTSGCSGWGVNVVQAELGPPSWDADDAGWMDRARQGTGVTGPYDTKTAFFWGRSSWGGPIYGQCQAVPVHRATESVIRIPSPQRAPHDHAKKHHGPNPPAPKSTPKPKHTPKPKRR